MRTHPAVQKAENCHQIRQQHRAGRLFLLAALSLLVAVALNSRAANIAGFGNGIMGVQAAVDGSPGTPMFQAGALGNLNDGNLSTRVDNYSGGADAGMAISYAGVIWPWTRYEQIGSVALTIAAFWDGGWFGPTNSGPGWDGTLTPAYLTEPTVQVSTNKGQSWTTVPFTSDYLTVLNGQLVGGTAANPNTLPAVTFTFGTPLTSIDGLRLIGPNGGTADGNGFLGVFELEIQATFTDSDGDSMPDAWEAANGLTVGVNDLGGDLDADGLLNYQEYQENTHPQIGDSDGDGYSDGLEFVNGTDPNDPKSIPGNLAKEGTGLLGTQSAAGIDTSVFNGGLASHINDESLSSRVDTFNGGGTDPLSFVGILWTQPPTNPVFRLELTLATFVDGGWFGPNGRSPAAGGALDATFLSVPNLQVTPDGGFTWTNVTAISDYLTKLTGHRIGGGGQPNPSAVTATFILNPPVSDIYGVRIIGNEGGSASGGFLGVFELKVYAKTDSDSDGMDDDWERGHGLVVGVNDADLDADADGGADGLTNIQEYQLGTDPQKADTDGDSLKDGAEVNTHNTNPLSTDTDADGLNDGAELTVHGTNPTQPDTDGDGFIDGLEVQTGSNPTNATSIPVNIALRSDAAGLLGTQDVPGGTPTLYYHVGSGLNINDGNPATRVDTWNDLGTDTMSFVGIGWTNAMTNPIARLALTLATFGDGGWFGPNNRSPAAGGLLGPTYLVEPQVQVSPDGVTWTDVSFSSDYLTALNGHGIGGGANPNPTLVTATFILNPAVSGMRAIRLVGTEGGVASGGFLGVAELTAEAKVDTDADGMDDDWESDHGLNVGLNDAGLDPDTDGLTNFQEYQEATDPQRADTDNDGLNDGAEVNTHQTNPSSADSDQDGLSDGAEVNTHHTNPLLADTDGDGFPDGQEVQMGYDPLSALIAPANLALRPDGVPLLGTEAFFGGPDTSLVPGRPAGNIKDGNINTRVDTWNDASGDMLSYVGIMWTSPMTNPIAMLELHLATFFDGGWFGTNNLGPGASGLLSTNEHLAEPVVQVTSDGGLTWNNIAFTSDYLMALHGHALPAAFGAPTRATARFWLTPPATGFNGVRILGSEGGTASMGFLGVFELGVMAREVQAVSLGNPRVVSGEFRFDVDTVNGNSYRVEYKTSLSDPIWQVLTTIMGTGVRIPVVDPLGTGQKFYRVRTQ